MEQALNAYKTQGLSVDNFLPVSHENCGDYENPSGDEPCTGGGWGKQNKIIKIIIFFVNKPVNTVMKKYNHL